MRISEIFLSIQGEGIETGLPTIFIRLSGCNLKCSWCDTKYSNSLKGKEMSINQILKKCEKFKIKRICITGGEPLVQKKECLELIRLLIKRKYEIIIETNGSIDIENIPKKTIISLDIKCPSSRMHDKMLYKNIKFIGKKDQVKFIIGNNEDYEFAKKQIRKYNLEKKTNVIFQPVYQNNFTKSLIRKILKDKLDVKFGLQVHKIVNIK
ncbi:MAG: radical SAM protein [Nanoarchaeota archaeon]